MRDHSYYRKADGGFMSRKLWYAIGTSIGIVLGAGMAAHSAAFSTVYETMVGGLLGSLGLYLGGNVGSRYVLKRGDPDYTSETSPPVEGPG